MSDLPFEVGEKYFIRTITMNHIGRVKKVTKKFLILEDSSWIADSGRWHDALKNGTLDEVEPFIKDVFVGIGAIVDATPWDHELPQKQK